MNYLLLLTMAFTVSLDSFFCGLATAVSSKRPYLRILGIAVSVFWLCFFGHSAGYNVGGFLKKFAEKISGILLTVIALFEFFSKDEEQKMLTIFHENDFMRGMVLGMIVGVDGGVGCFTLSLMGMTSLLVPIFIGLMHLGLMVVATIFTNSILSNNIKKFKRLPSLILFALGIYKII